jgi:hypothetical protein
VRTVARSYPSPGAAARGLAAGEDANGVADGAARGVWRGERGGRLGRSPERLETGGAKWVQQLELTGRGVLDLPRHGGPSLPARGA